MKTKFSVVLSILFLLSTNLKAQEKWSKLKIKIQSIEQRKKVIQCLQLDHFTTEGNALLCEVSQQDIARLKALSVKYEILVADLAQQLLQENRSYDVAIRNGTVAASRFSFDASCKTVAGLIAKPSAFVTTGQMGGYYSYAEMNTAMNDLVAAYPSLVQKFSIGKSVENRDIWAIKISDNVSTDESEPEVLYSGLQHAREAITGTSLIFFMQYLLENYGNARIQNLVNNRELFIIPCVNPDGYVQNQTSSPNGGGMWRKNKNMTLGDGVDLNRNYSVDWGRTGGGSSLPGDDTYWGTAAFSEPETQAMRNFITTRNFVAAIDQHCYGPYYSLPFGFTSPHTLSVDDQNFYSFIPALMGKYNCHRAGNSMQTVGYNVAGGIKDYFVLGDIGVGSKQKVLGMTGEAGGGGFWAPKADIIALCQGLCFQNLQLATAAGSYADITDESEIDIVTKSGSFAFTARRIGIGSDPVTISLVPIENIQSAGASVTATINTYFQTYSGAINYTLPATLANGSRLRFAWKVETGGITTYDTVVKFYVPNIILNDNMEGSLATNWNVGNGKASSKWSFTTAAAYQGGASLTESAAGDYEASDERIVTYNSSFSLVGATGAYLSFWVKHRAENCNDKLQVQVSTNGSTWTPVCGINTIAEAEGTLAAQPALTGIRETWTKGLFDLSGYINNSAVQFRLVFTSNADATTDDFYKKVDDGFYIDNVKLVKSSAALTALPVTFIDFVGKVQDNGTVALYWEAFTGNGHDHFEVERSADGINYVLLGQGNKNPPYDFLDVNPLAGMNYYRIRQVDKNGSITYSRIITINLVTKTQVTVFPNPVKDELHVKLNGIAFEKLRLELTDVQGRSVFLKEENKGVPGSDLIIPVKNWKPQLYILKIFDKEGRLLTVQKVVKL